MGEVTRGLLRPAKIALEALRQFTKDHPGQASKTKDFLARRLASPEPSGLCHPIRPSRFPTPPHGAGLPLLSPVYGLAETPIPQYPYPAKESTDQNYLRPLSCETALMLCK